MKKILIVAYACEPGKTSEPGVGWHFAAELAKFYELFIITRGNNRDVIERFLADNPEDIRNRIHWSYYDLPAFFRKMKRILPCGLQLYYNFWQWGVFRLAKRMCRREHFDLIHHLTFGLAYLQPPLPFLGRPCFWGPIGSGDTVPAAFLKGESLAIRFREWFYGLLSFKGQGRIPWDRLIRRRFTTILFRTSALAAKSIVPAGVHSGVLCETAFDAPIPERNYSDTPHPLHVLVIGRLNYYKGTIYALRGFERFLEQGGRGTIRFLGADECPKVTASFIAGNRHPEAYELLGPVPHERVLAELREADVLLHLSFREGGSWAIMEAMAYGLPVICQNRSGMRDMIVPECGTLLDASTPEELTERVAQALLEYEKNPGLIADRGKAAAKRIATEYTWQRRGEALKKFYDEAMA